MGSTRAVPCACVGLLAACVSEALETSDRRALFVEGRVRKDLEGAANHGDTIDELESLLSIDQLRLDTSGPALAREFSFQRREELTD